LSYKNLYRFKIREFIFDVTIYFGGLDVGNINVLTLPASGPSDSAKELLLDFLSTNNFGLFISL
jgi:hypothetical protein